MRVLFANAPWWSQDTGQPLRQGIRAGSRWPFTRPAAHLPDAFRFGAYLPFPFFLASAAAYAAREIPGAVVELRDSVARGESYSAFLAHLKSTRPDWIVIESATPSWDHDARVVTLIKQALPAVNIIVAGTLVTGAGFKTPATCVAAVKGEYEKNVVRVIRDGARGVLESDLLTDAEMNTIPFPMFDEVAALHYWDACPIGHGPPQLQFWTSRGCPYRCGFCAWPGTMTGNDPDGTGKRKVRFHSADWLTAFLDDRLSRAQAGGRPYRSLYLDDDTANLNDRHTIEVCGVMAKIGLPWSAMCRADTSSREVWQLMKDSGCFGVKIGFESGSQRVIDTIINKKLDLKEAEDTAKFLRSIGMTVHGTFTVGLPGETLAEVQQTTDFIERLLNEGTLNTHQLSGTAVIEGTPFAAIAAGAHLAKYPGATAEGFEVTGDGQARIERMRT